MSTYDTPGAPGNGGLIPGIVTRLDVMTGLRDRLLGSETPGQRVDRVVAASSPVAPAPQLDPSRAPIATPWSSTQLTQVLAEDIFGTGIEPVGRAAAMRVPALARGRNLLVSTIGRFPLRAYRGATELTPGPSWMQSTDGAQSPQLRLAWTVDDLIFYGWSCWWRDNGEDGYPLRVGRIEPERWYIDDDWQVVVDDQVVRSDSVVVFPGLHEGILSFGGDTVRDARSLMTIVRDRLLAPIPQTELHQVSGDPLTDDEIDDLVDHWYTARQRRGGVGYTNELIELKTHGQDDGNLLIEARNAAAVDIARLIGVSAGRLDATTPKASLNYETTTGRNQELVDFDLALYMTPITARLSLDDVMPRGQRAAFDLADFLALAPSVSGPATED